MSLRPANGTERQVGFGFWMRRVLEECEHASAGFAPDPVHDLRVALRRCRSMADGFKTIDSDPAWKKMKKAGGRLFRSLGELRDVHVMTEWVERLAEPEDNSAKLLSQYLAQREMQPKADAQQALAAFDRKDWDRWSHDLPSRASRVRPGHIVFQHLALERWVAAYDLHRRAVKGRSRVAWHQLRIGIKRFRYIVENFLPQQHEVWRDDLKEVQDLLGEIHDLDVLWATALLIHAFRDPEAQSRWQVRILEERNRRTEKYREIMMGKHSKWQAWRAELPQGTEIASAALARLRLWASFLDPDFHHSTRVARLALQLYDGLEKAYPTTIVSDPDIRSVLEIAALLHDVGRAKGDKEHHKVTYRMVHRLTPPLGCNGQTLPLAAAVARYHRGALPRAGQRALQGLSAAQKQLVVRAAGILRLANALDVGRNGNGQRLELQLRQGYLQILAEGYSPRSAAAQKIAAARHLLEVAYRRPVMVRGLSAPTISRRKSEAQRSRTAAKGKS